MFLTLMRLDASSPHVQRDLRDPQGLHRRVMSGFPSLLDPELEAREYFGVLHRLEIERQTGRVLLYVQSRMLPDWSTLPAGYLVEDGMPNPGVKSVGAVYDSLAAGRVFRFRLRANPTRKIDTKSGPNGERRNGRRVPLVGIDQQVAWLQRKAAEHGFELLQATIAATGATEIARSHATGVTLQGVLFEGRLVIRDAERVRGALGQGIGPGKAFGFGLLSIGRE